MKIKMVTFKHGNDFAATLECEHCQNLQELHTGYNDNYYHENVLPEISCKKCGKSRNNKETNNPDGLAHVGKEKCSVVELTKIEAITVLSSLDMALETLEFMEDTSPGFIKKNRGGPKLIERINLLRERIENERRSW